MLRNILCTKKITCEDSNQSPQNVFIGRVQLKIETKKKKQDEFPRECPFWQFSDASASLWVLKNGVRKCAQNTLLMKFL